MDSGQDPVESSSNAKARGKEKPTRDVLLERMRSKLGIKKRQSYTIERANPETGIKPLKRPYQPRNRTRTKPNPVNSIPQFSDHNTYMDIAGIQASTFDQDTDIEQTLRLLTQENNHQEKPSTSRSQSWEERMRVSDENWATVRTEIAQILLEANATPMAIPCGSCRTFPCQRASLRCNDCHTFMCMSCDKHLHKEQLHSRESWIHGFYHPLPSLKTASFSSSGELYLVDFDQFFPVNFPSKCRNCGATDCFSSKDTNAYYIAVTLRGRYTIKKQQPTCVNCKTADGDNELRSILLNGFWPGSPKKVHHIFDMKLLRWVDAITKNMPGTSLSSMAKALQDIGIEDGPINKTVLSRVLSEFRYYQREFNLLQGFDAMKCLPCSVNLHSAHVDGNFKVYRYSKVPRGANKPYYTGTFIVDDALVDKHKTLCYEKGQTQKKKSANKCGSSYWTAAKSTNTSRQKLAETGLEVAGCRHSVAIKAVNMTTGEQYCYPHYLHSQVLLPLGVKYLWQDVICKYWPWATKLSERNPQFKGTVSPAVRPALSVMHAKAHAWHCQVLWGGRNIRGAGGGAGEDMELFFSYLSRCGSTTKNMGKANREDPLTDHVLFWNQRKVTSMASQLCRRYVALNDAPKVTSEKLRKVSESIPGGCNGNTLDDWTKQVKRAAGSSKEQTSRSDLAEFFLMRQQMEECGPLNGYSGITTKEMSTLTNSMQLYNEVSNLREAVSKKRPALVALSERLKEEYKVDDRELYKLGMQAAVQEASSHQQHQIELACQAVKQKNVAISRLADTSKQRTRLRRKNQKERGIIEDLVAKYNAVQSLSTNEPLKTTYQDVINDNFPWISKGTSREISITTKKAAVDLHMLMNRYKEEDMILRGEMQNFIVFLQATNFPTESQCREVIF